MQQQNSYGRGPQQNTYSTSAQFSLNQPQGQFSLNQPQGQFSLNSNQTQGQFSNQPQGQFSNQPQGQFSNQPQGQFSNQPQGQFSFNQPQGYNNQSNNYGQGQGQFNVNFGQEGQNPNYGQEQFQPGQQPTSSADIATYMKKMPYTQILSGEEFTFSVLPKKQSTFFMTHERLLMMKGWDLLCYAREFPAGKQLPFNSLADVPAPKASYPLAQVEKCDVAEEKLTIRFAGPTKVMWQFVCPTKNCAIEWAKKIDAAKVTAVRNGVQTNYDYKYQEDMTGYDSPQKRGSQSPRQQGSPQQAPQFNANFNYNQPQPQPQPQQQSQPQPQYGGSTQQFNQPRQYSPSKHDFTINRDYNLSGNNNNAYSQANNTNTYSSNLGGNNYSSNLGGNYNTSTSYNSQSYNVGQNYQTGTPERQQFSVSVGLNNNNYNQGLEVRDNKQSFSTQGQSTISSSSINNPQLSRYPLTGPPQGYEPPRHF